MPVYDRFIPVRSATNFDLYSIWPPNGRAATAATTPPVSEYRRRLDYLFFGDRRRFLGFKSDEVSQNDCCLFPNPPPPPPPCAPRRLSLMKSYTMTGDYRLNVLDWGSSNLIAMGLGNTVFVLQPDEAWQFRLMTAPDDLGPVKSLATSPDGSTLAVGLRGSMVQLWDLQTHKRLTNLESPGGGAITAICWNGNQICTFGREDGRIVNCELFFGKAMSTFGRGHESGICSLKWSPGGSQLASGSTDGLVCIWDQRSGRNLHKLRDQQSSNNKASVSSLIWSPYSMNLNVLASAAGPSIDLWNTTTGSCISACQSSSRITGLVWSPRGSEILSSHWSSTDQFIFRRYHSFDKIDETLRDTGH